MSGAVVSVIIAVRNRPQMLREAVHSAIAQSHRPLEILIVDNASTDETAAVAGKLAQDHPGEVRVLECARRGAGAAREVGRRAARGAFIQYLDSDDLLAPDKLALQVAGLEASPHCGASYGVTRLLARDGTVLHEAWKRTGEAIDTLFPSMLRGRWWATSTPLYRRDLVERGGAWQNLLNEEDWEYDCRLAATGVSLHRVAGVVSHERDHGGDRLSRGGATDPGKLASRARAHELILGHARAAGIAADAPEMQHFSRALFLLSRQCGAAGLGAESARLFILARQAAGSRREGSADFLAYRALAGLLGWQRAGRLSAWLDTRRSRR